MVRFPPATFARRAVASALILLWPSLLSLPSASQSEMYVPPSQRIVPVLIENGVLLSEGSVSGSSATKSPAARQLFIVDTAATATLVSPRFARTLGAKGSPGEKLPDQILRVAGAEVRHRPVFVLSLSPWERQTGERISGIAGSDLLDHLAARIDYVHQQLTLLLPQSCAPSTDSIRLKVIGGLPFLEAALQTANGHTLQGLFLVDTGQAGPGLLFTSEFIRAHPEMIGQQTLVPLPTIDAAGEVRRADSFRIPQIQLGKYALRNVLAGIAPPVSGGAGAQLAGVIGGGVLAHFDVLVDLPQYSLDLTPNAHYADAFEVDMSGLLLVSGDAGETPGQRSYTVAAIAEKSPAAEAGMHTGDRIVEIAGHAAAAMSMEQIRMVLKSKPGIDIPLTIDRTGKVIRFTLTLRRAV